MLQCVGIKSTDASFQAGASVSRDRSSPHRRLLSTPLAAVSLLLTVWLQQAELQAL